MENNQTENLKLTTITPGETNWGATINSNFKKVDDDYKDLKAQINNIKYSTIENAGIFIDGGADYIDFTYTQNDKAIKIGTLDKEKNEIKGNLITDYTTLENGRSFYVWCGVNDNSNYAAIESKTPPYNMNWKNGDILIAYKKYINGKYEIEFKKLPQTLGKQYLIFNRIVKQLSSSNFTIEIPHYSVQYIAFSSVIVQTYYFANRESANSGGERVFIDYKVEQKNGNTIVTFITDINESDQYYSKLYGVVFYSAIKE